MQEHLSDCSPHYACLSVTGRGGGGKAVRKEGGSGEERRMGRWDIECLHLISVTGHLFAARSMSSNKGLRNND